MPSQNSNPSGPVFTAPISSVALTSGVPYDVFSLVSTAGRVELISIDLAQKSSVPSGVQGPSIAIYRGSTGTSTGAAITPVNVFGSSKAPSPVATVTGPSSVQISTTSATQVLSDAFDAANGTWRYRPERDARQLLETSQKLHLTVTAPSVGFTLAGTATFRQMAKTTT